MPTNIEDRIKQQEEKLKQLKIRKAKIEAAQKAAVAKKSRADDTRRKILVGSLLMEMMESDAELKASITARLQSYLTRDHDRALFGFTQTAPQATPELGDQPPMLEEA